MAGPWSSRQHELFAQLETGGYGISPGALAGTDAFKSHVSWPWTRVVAEYVRDKDQGNEASVFNIIKGKSHSTWKLGSDVIPSGNAATPTAPDMDPFYEAHGGRKHTATAHTTLAAGSTATIIKFTPGGAVASGIELGDIIVVDVDATFKLEARQITLIATDDVTLHSPLSAAPAVGRNVYTGTTYRLSAAQFKSIHLWGYLEGDNFRHKSGGNSVRNMDINIDFSSQTPVAGVNFSGEGKPVEPHATARPTAVTAGEPLLPTEAKAWIGASAVLCLVKAALKSDNGLELQQNLSCTLAPTGLTRSANSGNFNVTQELELLLMSGAVEGYYDNAEELTAYDCTIQLGIIPGKIVAWRTPRFIPKVDPGEQQMQVSLNMNGRALALTTPGTEFSLAFI